MFVQFQDFEADEIPWVVVIGEEEAAKGVVKLEDFVTRQEKEVKREDLVEIIYNRL